MAALWRDLDWMLVLPLSLLGLWVGVVSLYGVWPAWAEWLVWLAVGATWVGVLHFRIEDRFFWHGAVTGFIGGMLGIMTQVAFVSTYLSNNPDVAGGFGRVGTGQARWILFATGIAVSLVYGLVTGLALWITFPPKVRAAMKRARLAAGTEAPGAR